MGFHKRVFSDVSKECVHEIREVAPVYEMYEPGDGKSSVGIVSDYK